MKRKLCIYNMNFLRARCTLLALLITLFAGAQEITGVKELKVLSKRPAAIAELSQDIKQLRSNPSFEPLGGIQFSRNKETIITYGDRADAHVPVHSYMRVYSGDGSLLKPTVKLSDFPFAGIFGDDDMFYYAGNTGTQEQPSMVLMKFDRNGNKLWQKKIPDLFPSRLIAENGYVSLIMIDTKTAAKSSLIVYDREGALVKQIDDFVSISAFEFLPNGNLVVCSGTLWYLYAFSKDYKMITWGKLQGNAMGPYSIASHPFGTFFKIVSVGDPATRSGFRIQTFDGNTGKLLGGKTFEGQAFKKSYDFVKVNEAGEIELEIDKEILSLSMAE